MVFESGKDGIGVLRVEGNLTIQRASEFREALSLSVDTAKDLELDLTGVEDMDVACLQLVCSALMTCGIKNKSLTLKDRASGVCVQAIEASGLSPYIAKNLKTD